MKDYKQIAEILFPNIDKTPEYYYDKYRDRNLPEGAEVTRTAPSPTGYYHIGGLYGAIIDKFVAEKSGGIFYLRLEDTDQKREIEEAGQIAYEALMYFGVTPTEGYRGSNLLEEGEYGPYVQSKRGEIYQAFAKYLVSIGRAFPCFCDKAEDKSEILERREKELEEGNLIEHDKCRDLSVEEIANNVKSGKPFAIRLLSQGDPNKSIKIKDEIKGEREIRENGKDIVILKSNGIPPYALAHLVDDTLMHTTTVIRGEEWYQSLASHIELFEAFGLKHPKYAHTPVICKLDGGNKRKISKRKDLEASVDYYLKEGIPSTSVKDYLMNIANSNFENWRKQNKEADISEFEFSLNKMGISGALFDIVKLLDVSKTVISGYSAERVYEEALEWAEKYDEELAKMLTENKEYSLKVLGIERGNAKPRKDIAKWSEIKNSIEYMYDDIFDKNTNYEFQKITDKEEIKDILKSYLEKHFDINDDKQTWFDRMKDLAEEKGYSREVKEYKQNPESYKGHVGDISTVLRVALTGRCNTPDLYEIMQILGKDAITRRINKLI